jgi:hypothetical protein
MWHIRMAKELIAPGLLPIAGMTVQDAHVGGVGGVFEKIEPVVIGMAHRLDLPLAAALSVPGAAEKL